MSDYRIQKKQSIENNFKKHYYFNNSARACLSEILKQKCLSNKRILIPTFIGYSSNEGSGIFDPIIDSKTDYKFYKYTNKLEIDSDSLIEELDNSEPGIILFVHYFGFRDKNFAKLKIYAKSKKFIVIEDCAHAFFSFFSKPSYDSDYAIFSLHKMFHFNDGGFMYSKEKEFSFLKEKKYDIFSYDFYGIAKKRTQNFLYLLEKIRTLQNHEVTILRENLNADVPQTFPILLHSKEIRDYLYFELNKEGIGAVSLYHQLIDDITDDYKNEHDLADRILNLPIHQDVSFEDLDYLIEVIKNLINKF
jgi:dTDP-4-amino-4,6-dideoxygalactose transaminase